MVPTILGLTYAVGCSFGYNKMEDETHYLSGPECITLLVDVASQGGNLLLNVGPDEAGNIPPHQLSSLEYMAKYMDVNATAIHGTEEVDESVAKPLGGEEDLKKAWVRWLAKPIEGRVFAFVDGKGEVELSVNEGKVDLSSAKLLSGDKVQLKGKKVDLNNVATDLRPVCIEFQAL